MKGWRRRLDGGGRRGWDGGKGEEGLRAWKVVSSSMSMRFNICFLTF